VRRDDFVLGSFRVNSPFTWDSARRMSMVLFAKSMSAH
jgi:hypothetical protein